MVIGFKVLTVEDPMIQCRSPGLNYHPSSQSKKISIGIILDTSVKRSLGVAEGNSNNAAAKAEKAPSVTKHKEEKNNGGILEDPGEQQTSSPWVTTRSFREKSPALEFISPKNGQSSMKKFDGATCSRATKLGGWQRAEEFTSTNAQKVFGSRKPELESKTDEPENVGMESKTLKMKLWEILSSPNKQQSDTGAAEVGDHNLKSGNAVDFVVDTVVKPGQHSDTIELDSESLDHTTKRPVTRAVTRKQSGNRRCPEVAKTNTCKRKAKGGTFSFHEGWVKKQGGVSTIKGGASIPQRTRVGRKDSGVKPRKMLFCDKVDKKVEQTAYRHDGQPPRQKTSSFSDGHGSFLDCVQENTREKSQSATIKLKKVDGEKSPANGNLKEAFNTSLGNKLGQADVFRRSTFQAKTPASALSGGSTPKTVQMGNGTHSPATSGERNTHRNTPTLKHSQSANNKREKVDLDKSPGNVYQEIFVDTALEDILRGAADFHSPTFRIETPIVSTSAGSTPINMEKGAYTPETSREVNEGNVPSPKHLQSPRPDTSTSSSETELPDDVEKIRNYRPGDLTARHEKGDAERKFNESSSEENDSESNHEASPVIRGYNFEKENIISPTVAEELEYPFHPTKRPRSCGENREDYWSQESVEQNQGNDMSRVVKLFASALERIRRKINSATAKKSTEIIMSISEEIKYQLQYAESQIQTDMLKLTSFSKDKRKSLEKRCQEQQEQMKLIHEKFRDQLDHHLQDCESTVEELEAHQADLKGMVKRQKAVHQKLLEQVEEIVETQINSAEKRVAAVRESKRQKLMQLKLIVVECLKDEQALGL